MSGLPHDEDWIDWREYRQKLFNAIADCKGLATEDDMAEIERLVLAENKRNPWPELVGSNP